MELEENNLSQTYLMKITYSKIVILVLILTPFFYYFVLIPLYNKCKEAGGNKYNCVQYLVRF